MEKDGRRPGFLADIRLTATDDGILTEWEISEPEKEHLHKCLVCQRRICAILVDTYKELTGIDPQEQYLSTSDTKQPNTDTVN